MYEGTRATAVREHGAEIAVELPVTRHMRASSSKPMPEAVRMRAIRYQRPGFRAGVLLTSLLAFNPGAQWSYVPSVGEIHRSAGLSGEATRK